MTLTLAFVRWPYLLLAEPIDGKTDDDQCPALTKKKPLLAAPKAHSQWPLTNGSF
jgi:hypothetical protein